MSNFFRKPEGSVKKEVMHNSNILLSSGIDALALSLHPSNCLCTAGIHTMGDLLQKTETDLLRCPDFDSNSLHEVESKVKKWCADFGISGTKLQKSIFERELRVNSNL